MRKKLIAGNWKMNLGPKEALELVDNISVSPDVDVLISPVFPVIPFVRELADKKGIFIAAQNCHQKDSGAFTGEVPASILLEVGCTHVILGHSERRTIYKEGDKVLLEKTKKAIESGLHPIFCIGESEKQREEGETNEVLASQLKALLKYMEEKHPDAAITIAYEPVWAIGTGKTPTSDQIRDAHACIRGLLSVSIPDSASIRILYGGSLKPANALEILEIENVDGGLIGGASLKSSDFNELIQTAAGL